MQSCTLRDAAALVPEGSTVLFGGFMDVGFCMGRNN